MSSAIRQSPNIEDTSNSNSAINQMLKEKKAFYVGKVLLIIPQPSCTSSPYLIQTYIPF